MRGKETNAFLCSGSSPSFPHAPGPSPWALQEIGKNEDTFSLPSAKMTPPGNPVTVKRFQKRQIRGPFQPLPLQPACGRVAEESGSHNRNTSEDRPQKVLISPLPQRIVRFICRETCRKSKGRASGKKEKGTGGTAWKPYLSP